MSRRRMIVFNLAVWRENEDAVVRKTRRLVYLALIAQDAGYEVAIHVPPHSATAVEGMKSPEPQHREHGRPLLDPVMFPFARHLNGVEVIARTKAVNAVADAYFCSHQTVHNLSPFRVPDVPIVAWKESLGCERDGHLADKCALIVGYVTRREDFTHPDKHPWPDRSHTERQRIEAKTLGVPWIPHERVLRQIDDDGLVGAYLTDDLDAIRQRYGCQGKVRLAGIMGRDWPWRREIAARCDGWAEAAWAGYGFPQRSAGEYLRWVSECRVVMNLPGDTWKCSRFAESVMMGVPCAQLAGMMPLLPSLTRDNSVLVGDWSDEAAYRDGAERSAEIVRKADLCYRDGWSLRGQFLTACRKVGLSPR